MFSEHLTFPQELAWNSTSRLFPSSAPREWIVSRWVTSTPLCCRPATTPPSVLLFRSSQPNANNYRADSVRWASSCCCDKQLPHLHTQCIVLTPHTQTLANAMGVLCSLWLLRDRGWWNPCLKRDFLSHAGGKRHVGNCGWLFKRSPGMAMCYLLLYFTCQTSHTAGKSWALMSVNSPKWQRQGLTMNLLSCLKASKFFSNFWVLPVAWQVALGTCSPGSRRPESPGNFPQALRGSEQLLSTPLESWLFYPFNSLPFYGTADS